jgi:hypothetical protein
MGRDDCGSSEPCDGPHDRGAVVNMDPELGCDFGELFGQEEYYGDWDEHLSGRLVEYVSDASTGYAEVVEGGYSSY